MMRSALLHKTQNDWQQVSSAGQEKAIERISDIITGGYTNGIGAA